MTSQGRDRRAVASGPGAGRMWLRGPEEEAGGSSLPGGVPAEGKR